MIDQKDKILRGEIYCRLVTIKKYYYNLLNQTFPTEGSRSLVKLVIKITNILQKQYEQYSIGQIKHIGTLCCGFEAWCGYLFESRITNVPWSIIPALEEIFKNIKKNFQFAICPIWEFNYKITKKNVIEELKKIARIPNFLFEFKDKTVFDKEVEKFFEEYPEGLYFILFPKLERLSALHFALLGHEIGHTFAQKWKIMNFQGFVKNFKLEDKFNEIAEEESKTNQNILKTDVYRKFKVNYYFEVTRKILMELISDIFGSYIFGDSSLIALYLFALRTDLDSINKWEYGYLSLRYRLKLINDSLEYIKNKINFKSSINNGWDLHISDCINKPCKDLSLNNRYVKTIIDLVELNKKKLFDDIYNEVNNQIFYKHINDDLILKVKERLKNNIIPNSFFDDALNENPIGFRNILYGTCMYLIEDISSDISIYEKRSKNINLLSIKGIELSIEQDRFNNDSH